MEFLEISISGAIKTNNFESWRRDLLDQIELTNLELATDSDFIVASDNVKLLKVAEKTLKECKIKALEETHEIQALFNAIDEIAETARQTRLVLERQVRTKKQQIKSDLINKAQQSIVDYCESKTEAFSYLDSTHFSNISSFESVIKGKSSLTGVEKALNEKVQALKEEIDTQEEQANQNFKLISKQKSSYRVLLQDLQHLISLPHSELTLTIKNRIVTLSEEKALRSAKESESELQAVSNEALHGVQDGSIGDYVVLVEVSSTRTDAISIARDIKQFLAENPQVTGIKLSKQSSEK